MNNLVIIYENQRIFPCRVRLKFCPWKVVGKQYLFRRDACLYFDRGSSNTSNKKKNEKRDITGQMHRWYFKKPIRMFGSQEVQPNLIAFGYSGYI